MPYSHSSVDEQVVKMAFDNSNFDQNINASIQALNNLDNKLFALNKQDFSGITNSLDKLANVFTVKGQVMLGVFARLGSEAVNLGLKLKNSLISGVKDGLGEYKQIIDSTETIFQNVKQSGATLTDVNNALDELNDYADKTIYNFSQMTRMIGMFTSAGVSLNKSVATIKGLANAAALVGANADRAQIAWNAVSRAMSSGTFSNVTWRSLELSNIAGQQFNKVITEVARANKVVGKSGKNIDQMIKKYGSLRLTLSEGWLTKNIFAEAMQIMSGDLDEIALKQKGYTEKQIKELIEIANSAEAAATQVKTFQQLIDTTKEAIGSGWAQSFRILIGDLERAKDLFTRISVVINDFIDNNAKIRNELFRQVVGESELVNEEFFNGLATGKDSMKQTIENIMAIFKTFFKSVKVGFLNIFPIERISTATRKVLDIVQKATKALVLNEKQYGTDEKGNRKVLGWDTEHISAITEAIKDLIRFFRGLASAADIAWMAISQPIKVIIDRIPFFKNFFENTNSGIIGLLKNLGKFGDKITVVRNAIKDTQIFAVVLEYFLDNIDEIGKKFPILGFFLNIFKNLKNVITKIKEGFKSFNIKPLSALFGAFKFVAEGAFKVINAIFEVFSSIKNKIDWTFLDKPKAAIIAFIKKLSDYGRGLISFEDITKKIGKSIKDTFDKIITSINKFFSKSKLKTGTGEIPKYMTDIKTTTTKAGNVITDIWNKIKGFFGPIGDFFKKIKDGTDWSFDGVIKKLGLIAGGAGAAALGISSLVKTFGRIKIVNNINDLLGAGIDVIKAYQKQAQSKMILNIAIAIGILAASMAALSLIPYDKLENGLVIFSGFISVLSITLTPIITSIARFNESLGNLKKTLTGYDVLNNFVKELGKFGKRIASGINNRLFGQAAKDFAMSLFIITGAVAALTLLFKLDGESTKRAINNLINLIFALTGAMTVLAGTVTVLSKIGSKSNPAAIFSTFFSMAGVATVILSIAAAVAVLTGSLMALANVNNEKLEQNFKYLRELLLWTAGISVVLSAVTGIISNFNKTGSKAGISGIAIIVVAIAGSVAIMTQALSKLADKNPKILKKVHGYVLELLKTIGGIAALITGLIALSRLLGDYRDNTGKILLAMLATVVAVAGAMHLLGKAGPIDQSVIDTLTLLTVALGLIVVLLSVTALVVSRAKTTFSANFADAINKVSVGIGVIIASIGVMTLGIAALFKALGDANASEADANRAANGILTRLNIVAETIKKSLPQIRKVFYNLGLYAGNAFTAFTLGFADNLVATGDAYNKLIIKIVNLIVDILGKALNTLHERKEDVRKIIRQAIDLIASIITEVVNDVFYKGNYFQLKEEDLLKMLGFGGLIAGGGSLILKLAGNFNTLANAAKNLKLAETFGPLIGDVQAGISLFGEAVKSGKEVGTAFKLAAGAVGNLVFTIVALAAALAAIKVGIQSISVGLRQLDGEARYIRSDVTDWGSALKAVFTDSDFRTQMFVDGFTRAGEIIVNVFMTIVNAIRTVGGALGWLIVGPLLGVAKLWSKFFDMIGQKDLSKSIDDFVSGAAKSINENLTAYKKIGDDWTRSVKDWDAPLGDNVVDGAKKTVDAIEETSDDIANASYNAGVASNEAFANGLNSSNPLESALSWLKNSSIPSSTLEYIKASMRQVGFDMGAAVDQGYQDFTINVGTNGEKKISVNKEYLQLINEERDALIGLTKEEQIEYLLNKAKTKGIKEDLHAFGETYAAILSMQEYQTKIYTDGIDALNNKITDSVDYTMGRETAAVDNFLTDSMNSMNLMTEIAEEHIDELVGKKQEEVEEFLTQEAIKRGLTEEEAKEAAKNLMAIQSGSAQTSAEISSGELKYKIDVFKSEYEAFEALENAKVKKAEAAKTERELLAKTEYARVKEAYEKGYMTTQDYAIWTSNNQKSVTEYNELKKKIAELEKPYNDAISKAKKFITTGWSNQGLSSDEISKKWKENVEGYKEAAKEVEDLQKKSITTTIKQFLDKIKNGIAGALDLGGYNLGDGNKNDNGSGNDKDKAVKAAADLKTDLEKERADLTPTFDLDKLASDANKASGIVMSSLMAAQNASIGDYINKDSQLNPFMKDRWQNVYNFTQNNYSPKALSRIDIYRQTQRQISMSRGF